MLAAKDTLLTRPSGAYRISRSVRLRSSASAYFNRTPASATNRKTFTFSAWLKRGQLGSSEYSIFTGYTDANNRWLVRFESDTFRIFWNVAGTSNELITSAIFRDPSAWYHFVVAVDTTQATNTNRIKVYVNGVEQTLTGTYIPQNTDTQWNNNVVQQIGRKDTGGGFFDGYITEINSIDGQALTPSSFGETNVLTGVWQPKAYTGTYGTNGFELNFSDNSTAAALGTDFSGNSNTWTVNNISVTAGVTYDSMLDVPTLYADGGNGRGNYAVGNPVYTDAAVSATYTNGNLTWSCPNTGSGKATISATTGKFYWEAIYLTNAFMTGVSDVASVGRYNNSILYQSDGTKGINGTFTSYGATYTTGDVIGVALDLDGGTVTFYKNNSSQGSISLSLASITNATAIIVGGGGSANTGNWNFGQRPFSYTPPSGFLALNTQNLPTPTISNGAAYMAATLYTGDNTTSRTINNAVNGISFQPDLVWIKKRSAAQNNVLNDSVRGFPKNLYSDATNAEDTSSYVASVVSGGFVTGSSTILNTSPDTYVAWQWNAGGSTVTNTSGTISAQVRANTTAGFSVVTYTGTGANATVGHGLGVAPKMVIVKNRASAFDWVVWHTAFVGSDYLILNATSAVATAATLWNSTTPTSSVFSVGTSTATNASGSSHVAYCFSAVAGFSAFGSYTGNASTDGTFVYLGFEPRWVMIKRTDTSGDWQMYDTSRAPINVASNTLYANGTFAEDSNTTNRALDLLSNGFKLRSSATFLNASGGTYIYAAFAENPFKLSLAR